ncbi:Fibrous sheath-interacting protein 1 [Gaertneriomyces sp. JEL0708]|nr:Fibrous sheath-interacting protein 1 [Gaertneriomyces sp. JEL0708]
MSYSVPSSAHSSRPTSSQRSQTGTPIRNVRRNSTRSDGGLTPLGSDDLPTIFLSNDSIYPSSAPPTATSLSLTTTPTHRDGRKLLDCNIPAFSSEQGDSNADDDAEDDEHSTQQLLEEMRKRHDQWDVLATEVKAQLEQIHCTSRSPDDTSWEGENTNAETAQLDQEQALVIQQGLQRIRELDTILRQKSMIARSLKSERLTRESSAAPIEPSRANSDIYDPDSDDESLELRSVHSQELNEKTFITEPKMGTRIKIGVQALREVGTRTQVEVDSVTSYQKPKKKGYTLGNFIERNIALGPEARYYSAMTEEEVDRVEQILQAMDDDEMSEAEDGSICGAATPMTDVFGRPSTTSTAFFPDEDEVNRLIDIEKKLQLILPEQEWETKSGVFEFSLPHTADASGSQTPKSVSSAKWARPSFDIRRISMRDVNTILHDVETTKQQELFQEELETLRQIDKRLQELESEESRPMTREVLDGLLRDCLFTDCELRFREAAADETDPCVARD